MQLVSIKLFNDTKELNGIRHLDKSIRSSRRGAFNWELFDRLQTRARHGVGSARA